MNFVLKNEKKFEQSIDKLYSYKCNISKSIRKRSISQMESVFEI